MKKIIIWFLVGVVVGLVAGYFYITSKDAPLKKENALLKEEITTLKVIQEELEKVSMARIEGLLEQIGGLQGNIDSLMFANVQLETDLETMRHGAVLLEAEAEELRTEVQPVIDANPKLREYVGNLLSQIKSGKDQFSLAMKRADNYEQAFVNSEKIRLLLTQEVDTYKGLWTGEKALRQKVELRLSLQDKRVASLGTRLTLTNMGGGLIVAAGLIAILSR